MFRSRPALLVIAVLAAAPWIGGCTATRPTGARAPDDLTIEVTILRGAGVPEHSEAHRRAARLVLFADGALHYADEHDDGFRAGSSWLPKPTRAIDPEAMDAVWSIVQRLGLVETDATLPPPNLDRVVGSPGTLTYVVGVTAGRRSRVRIDRVPDEPGPDEPGSDEPGSDDPGALASTEELVRTLVALAWGTDRPDARLVTAPRRYDFGPDPYARFRQP